MKLEDINEEWSKDAEINRTDLQWESARTGLLFSKYFNMLVFERKELRRLQGAYAKKRKEHHDFYMNPDPERSKRLGLEPPTHQVKHTETPLYIEGDDAIQNIDMAIGLQSDKVEYLEEILKIIRNRQFAIRDIIEDRKFYGTET